MVEVVSTIPDPAVAKETSCQNCGARLRYVPNDVKEYHDTDYGGGSSGSERIICPNCGKETTVRSW